MKVLLDTNVFFPVVTIGHPNHEVCSDLVTDLNNNHDIVVLNTHLISELYSNLTRIEKLKISPSDASKTIHHLVDKFDSVDLTVDDYLLAVDRCASLNLVSGVIFDALHFQAAIKAEVDVLYTFNIRDFKRLVTEEITFEIKSPLE